MRLGLRIGCLILIQIACLFPRAHADETLAPSAAQKPSDKKVAVIFDGPTVDKDCKKNMAMMAEARGFTVVFAKPGETTPELLKTAAVYMVPGGDDVKNLKEGWTPAEIKAIRNFVWSGGNYMGVCLGGYWAAKEGTWAGTVKGFKALNMIPAVVHSHSKTPEDRVEEVMWHDGKTHDLYFQDGPEFDLHDPKAKIYGTYTNGKVAAFSSTFGKGHVAISGVHWEATDDWYHDPAVPLALNGKPLKGDPEPDHIKLGYEMLDDLLGTQPAGAPAAGAVPEAQRAVPSTISR